jgi:hypothetical protein
MSSDALLVQMLPLSARRRRKRYPRKTVDPATKYDDALRMLPLSAHQRSKRYPGETVDPATKYDDAL